MMRRASEAGDCGQRRTGELVLPGIPRRRRSDVRSNVQVRAAEPDDLTSLVRLCLEARAESTVGAQLCTSDSESLRHQIGALLATPGGVVLVATVDGAPAGLLLARLVGPSVFSDVVSLAVEAVYVARDARRRGVGHALLAGAVEVADEGAARSSRAAWSSPPARRSSDSATGGPAGWRLRLRDRGVQHGPVSMRRRNRRPVVLACGPGWRARRDSNPQPSDP